MTPYEAFDIEDGPQPFGFFVRSDHDESPIEVHGLDGFWLQIQGEGLPENTLVRVEHADDGRFLVTGLVVGLHRRREITWETLRQIRPASIVAEIFEGVDPENPVLTIVETDEAPPELVDGEAFDARAWLEDDKGDDPVLDMSSARARLHRRAQVALQLWQFGDAHDRPAAVEPVTRPGARVATDLARVAAVYERHLAATPRRATQATAEELHVSRATAIRRLAECRRAGLLQGQGGQR